MLLSFRRFVHERFLVFQPHLQLVPAPPARTRPQRVTLALLHPKRQTERAPLVWRRVLNRQDLGLHREVPLTSHVDLARLLEERRGKAVRFIVLRDDRDLVGTVEVRGPAGDDR